MTDIEYIESFFQGDANEEERRIFEDRIARDSGFAEEVAFYISAQQAIKEHSIAEKKIRFREIYEQQKVDANRPPKIRLWKWAAAAVVILLVVGGAWVFLQSGPSPQQLASKYIENHFGELSVSMNTGDSLQEAINLFNKDQLREAERLFEHLKIKNTNDETINTYAGITFLRLGKYESALECFGKVEANTNLYSNPGKFYRAITLLKRNAAGDKAAARRLLREVVEKDLEGRKEAERWLNRF